MTPESPIASVVIDKLPTKLLAQLEGVRPSSSLSSSIHFDLCCYDLSQGALPPQQMLETLDILSDLFARFPILVGSRPELQTESLRVLVSLLDTGRLAVKKKAILALGPSFLPPPLELLNYLTLRLLVGNLIPSIPQKLFASLSRTITSSLASPSSSETARAYVQLVGTLSRSAPQKTGSMLKDVMPAILASCAEDKEEDDKDTGLQVRPSSGLAPCRFKANLRLSRPSRAWSSGARLRSLPSCPISSPSRPRSSSMTL